jgi:hypothetical protein
MLARGFTGCSVSAAPRARASTGKRFHLAACDLVQPALLAAAITPLLRIIAEASPRR